MRMHSPLNDLTGRLLKKLPGISLETARAGAEELLASPSLRICYVWTLSPTRYRSRERLNSFAAEFFAQAILRRLEIGTAPEHLICAAEQARTFSDDFIVKFDRNGWNRNLSWNPRETPTGWCLASRVVPDAASLFFVARRIVKSYSGRQKHNVNDELADTLYSKFSPTPVEVEQIKLAMDLEGAQYLSIAAARVFLGCTCTPHFGNILVNKAGKLFSIDHSDAEFRDGEEIKGMFDFIGRDSRLLKVLSGVADLTESDIRESVEAIPKHPACRSISGLAKYFCERLKLWKKLYSVAVRPA